MELINVENLQTFSEIKAFVEEHNLQVDTLPSTGLETVHDLQIDFGSEERFNFKLGAFQDAARKEIVKWLKNRSAAITNYNPLIFGKDNTENVVSCEVHDGSVDLFIEKDGKISIKTIPNKYWLLAPVKYDSGFTKLEGKLYYNWIKYYDNKSDWWKDRKNYARKDIYSVTDDKEAAMILNGFTYFKNMKVSDVSLLSFDIETDGLARTETSRVYLIANTFRSQGKTIRKMFSCDDYESDAEMFEAWCEWVREIDPTLMIGYNIFGYDIPYLKHCAALSGVDLNLGRDGSALTINKYESKFRKDGSQDYLYNRANIYGREIVDMMFVAYHYDFGRKYDSYGLKAVIKHEGLEVKDRQFYDAGTIKDNWDNLEERVKIKKYAEHDGDDPIALFDLMIVAYFYLNQSVPKTFQQINYSASGSQINSFLVRSYLQNGHSISKASDAQYFEGATSFGNCGIFKNVFKVDVASLYPSIMLAFQVHDKYKDPNQHFLKMVEYFTNERLVNKQKGKEDRYYKDLSEAQKIVINSSYGLLGATGLNFNSPLNAALVTRKGREILKTAIDWAESWGFQIVNGDTDSISLCFEDFSDIDPTMRKQICEDLNELYPEQIRWEDDGYYTSVVVIKTKNYILKGEDGKLKIKGSALKASMKEIALKEFIKEIIDTLVDGKKEDILPIYNKYIYECFNVKDISRWCSKRTVTASVLNPERTNEQKVLDAIGDSEVQMGDKIRVYFANDKSLKLQQHWNGDHDPLVLVKKVYDSLKIFANVLDMEQFPKYTLKSHDIKVQLHELLGLPIPEKVKKTRKKKE